MRQRGGQVWVWDGHTPCSATACPGWSLIDSNTRSVQIAAAGNRLFQLVQIAAAGDRVFQLHVDGKLWQWDGKSLF